MALGCMTGTIMRHRGERTPNQLEQKPAKRAHGLVAGSIWYHSPAKVADARGIKAGPVRQALRRGHHFKKLGQAREHLAKPIKVGGKTYAGSSEAA